MYPISELLMGGSIRTAKSGVLIENIDRVEFDDWGKLRIRGYVSNGLLMSHRFTERWTILDPYEIDRFS
jgi:hypothetical protein